MYGKHPRTGAPIRIVTADAPIWRDGKTLVWLDGTEPTLTTVPWNRWSVGTASLQGIQALQQNGVTIDMALLLGDAQDLQARVDWLRSGAWKKIEFFAVPRELVEAIGFEALAELNVTNMLCLEDCLDVYPFLKTAWDGTVDHAKCMVAQIFRYGVTFPVAAPPALPTPLKTEPALREPPRLWFLTQYYKPEKTKRAREIDTCLRKNVENTFIDRIVLLNEEMYDLEKVVDTTEKIEQQVIGERLRFSTVVKWIYEHAPKDVTVVFANSDIYLDETTKELWTVDMDQKFLSLLRWDDQEDPAAAPVLFGPRPDSQDTWIVSAASIQARTWDWDALDFPFGKGGCDNAINVEMLRQKFLVANPAMTIRTHHVHQSGYRTYDPQDIVDKPMYMYLTPSGIHEYKPDYFFPSAPVTTLTTEAWSPSVSGPTLTDAQRQTYETMLWRPIRERATREQRELTAPELEGLVPATRVPIYELSNVFHTRDGLPYTYQSILVGEKTAAANDAWSSTEIGTFAKTLEVETALLAHCPDQVAHSPISYMLRYLGKIFWMRDTFDAPLGEFLGANRPEIKEVLSLFAWPKSVITVVDRSKPFQAWCSKAYYWPVADERSRAPTEMEITALRRALRNGWVEAPRTDRARVVCVVDAHWVTPALVTSLKEALPPEFDIQMLYKDANMFYRRETLEGATGVFVVGGKDTLHRWGLLWMLPRGAWVCEIQSEMDVNADIAQLCSVSGLRHALHVVPRDRPATKEETAEVHAKLVEACRALSADHVTTNPVCAERPTLFMPFESLGGIFYHAGDSFRETAQLWAERGYVNLQKTAGVGMVWLGGVGETLLYDRPTLEWLQKAPKKERTFKVGLFGNPTPPEGGQAWSFWPRRPRFVEELVAAGAAATGWEARAHRLVFYGRSENAVQKARRTAADWGSAFTKERGDEWVYVEGAAAKYPFTQREYLERLATARFGLCLAGYGSKCHREVECMAMGCVPVVASEVDMTSYAEPPVEGVHYLRVTSPEEIEAAIAAVTPERWVQMSAAGRDWWARNASADGMWRLTQRLVSEAQALADTNGIV